MHATCVVLAAGLGTRMNSSLPKVLHTLHGRPMLQFVIDTLMQIKPAKIIVVVGKQAEQIKRSIQGTGVLSYVIQRAPKGTGDALSKAVPSLQRVDGTVLVVNGDSPLLSAETIRKFLVRHRKKRSDISLLSFMATDPGSYGRVLRDAEGGVLSIVEDRDATAAQRQICEVNSGVYAIEPRALRLLKNIKVNKAKGEFYLTDIVDIGRRKGMVIDAFSSGSEDEFIGINTPRELEQAAQLMRVRITGKWRDRGVQFIDPASVFISVNSMLGQETIVYPHVHIQGETKIGRGCTIFPNVRILDSMIEDGAIIKDSTLIERSVVKKNATVGPFAHIRPGCTIGEDAKIGNFVEVKNSEIGPGTKASHLSYLGDARIGKAVNIGAGTITCNYDGYHKYLTAIEDNVFIGSDTQLIAPVRIARGAIVGAGSTITGDVPPYALAVSRVKQTNIANWARRRQKRKQHAQDSRKGKRETTKK